jgi:hypothetical protein
MKKGQEEDLLSEQTLKTIEIVNIKNISDEKTNLEKAIVVLRAKTIELTKQEDDLERERRRREERSKKKKEQKLGMN